MHVIVSDYIYTGICQQNLNTLKLLYLLKNGIKKLVIQQIFKTKSNHISLGLVQRCVYCCTSIILHKVIRPPNRPYSHAINSALVYCFQP